jgi:voltage-gated potassium channel
VRRRLLIALLPIAVVLAASALGYMAFWGWSLQDALYMTVITVGTVGFREVRPLTPSGELFTMAVILAGIIAGTYALSGILSVLLEGQLFGVWEGRRMTRRIADLHGHTVLAGIGRVGSAVARTLVDAGAPFVVVDASDEAVQMARDEEWPFVQGDATDEDVLREAGVERAGSVITALDTDAENLYVTVTVRALNPGVFIVSRSSHESTEKKLLQAGANRVLTPNVIGGRRMATMALHPTVSDYLDLVAHGSGLEYRLQEVVLAPGSWLDGRSLAEARVRETTGAYVLAVRHRDGEIDTNPAASTTVHAGDRLVVLGTGAQVESVASRA